MWNIIGTIGTLVELVGFVILSVDLLPEYKSHKRRMRIERFRLLFERREWLDQRQNMLDELDDSSVTGERKAIAGLLLRMDLTELFNLIDDRSMKLMNPEKYNNKELNGLLARAEQQVKSREIAILSRKRPPLIAGILIVILGVFLQVVGGLPSPVRCPLFASTSLGSLACD